MTYRHNWFLNNDSVHITDSNISLFILKQNIKDALNMKCFSDKN